MYNSAQVKCSGQVHKSSVVHAHVVHIAQVKCNVNRKSAAEQNSVLNGEAIKCGRPRGTYSF